MCEEAKQNGTQRLRESELCRTQHTAQCRETPTAVQGMPQKHSRKESCTDFPGQEPGLDWQQTQDGKIPSPGWGGGGAGRGVHCHGVTLSLLLSDVAQPGSPTLHGEKLRHSPTCPSRLPAQAMHSPQCCITAPQVPLPSRPPHAPGSSWATVPPFPRGPRSQEPPLPTTRLAGGRAGTQRKRASVS